MNTQFLIRILLVLHLTGLVIMAGTTVVDYFTFKTFCKLASETDSKASGLLPIMARYGELVRAGAAILIVTGIGMLALIKGAWLEQLWFKIKMTLVVLLIRNGMLVGNKQGLNFRGIVEDNGAHFMQRTAAVKANLNRFYWMQLALFFSIILLSVIK